MSSCHLSKVGPTGPLTLRNFLVNARRCTGGLLKGSTRKANHCVEMKYKHNEIMSGNILKQHFKCYVCFMLISKESIACFTKVPIGNVGHVSHKVEGLQK